MDGRKMAIGDIEAHQMTVDFGTAEIIATYNFKLGLPTDFMKHTQYVASITSMTVESTSNTHDACLGQKY
jgi:hypothetical protein